MRHAFSLEQFVIESNMIEGIYQKPSPELMRAARDFIASPAIVVDSLVRFVAVAQPNAVLRDRPGLNVRVGNYIAPPGGPEIVERLHELLASASSRSIDAYGAHVAYETLHPFTDGNGRSGRMLWLWAMGGIDRAPLGFLHTFYYQTLERSEGRPRR